MKGEGDSQGEPKYILPRASQDRAYLSSDFWLADEDPEEIIARDEATLSKLGMPSQAVQLSRVQGRVESNRSKRAPLSRIPSRDEELRERIGQEARQTVKERFLMIRLLEEHLDLLNSFETIYRLGP